MRDLIVPDFDRTIQIDPELERMRFELDRLERRLPDADEDRKVELATIVEDMRSDMREYEQAGGLKWSLTMGYVPASKLTEIRHKAMSLHDVKEIERIANVSSELDRETVAWGLRGWNLANSAGPVAFVSDVVMVSGREFKRAAALMVEIVESMDWLASTAHAIHKLNTLSEDQKKR